MARFWWIEARTFTHLSENSTQSKRDRIHARCPASGVCLPRERNTTTCIRSENTRVSRRVRRCPEVTNGWHVCASAPNKRERGAPTDTIALRDNACRCYCRSRVANDACCSRANRKLAALAIYLIARCRSQRQGPSAAMKRGKFSPPKFGGENASHCVPKCVYLNAEE